MLIVDPEQRNAAAGCFHLARYLCDDLSATLKRSFQREAAGPSPQSFKREAAALSRSFGSQGFFQPSEPRGAPYPEPPISLSN